MRIFEVETFGRGGLAHYAYNLSCALLDRGHEVTLVTPASFELEGQAEIPSGLAIVRVGSATRPGSSDSRSVLASVRRKWRAVIEAFEVARAIRRSRPEIVHLHCTNPIALLQVLLIRLAGALLVTTAHVVTPHEKLPLQRLVYRWIHRASHVVVAHSNHDRDRLLDEFSLAEEQVAVIPHGEYGFFERETPGVSRSSARAALGLGETDSVALFFGYIREYKGLDLLFEAWPAVQAQCPKARLVVAGDPIQLDASRRSELEEWAARLGVVHRFEYIPFAAVESYFCAADLLVMPYRHISQSGVLFLALSIGVPVIATRVGGLEEILVDGENSLLVPPEDPPSLADALSRLLGDGNLRRHLVAGGRRLAEQHSWPAIAGKSETVFASLLGN